MMVTMINKSYMLEFRIQDGSGQLHSRNVKSCELVVACCKLARPLKTILQMVQEDLRQIRTILV